MPMVAKMGGMRRVFIKSKLSVWKDVLPDIGPVCTQKIT